MPKLQDKVALVTGASKGIGAGIARELAASGAAVAVVSAITASGGRAVALPGNVSKADDVVRLLAETVRTLGALDVLVNNAGVYSPTPLEAVTEDEFHRQIDTNVLGPLLVMREPLKHFGPAGGSVINVGSAASRMYAPGFAVYTASKAALDALTGVLAKELAARRIRVNSVNPGATLSEGTKASGLYGVGSEFEKQLVAMTPLGRVGVPADIAKVVAFLASDESGWLTVRSSSPPAGCVKPDHQQGESDEAVHSGHGVVGRRGGGRGGRAEGGRGQEGGGGEGVGDVHGHLGDRDRPAGRGDEGRPQTGVQQGWWVRGLGQGREGVVCGHVC